jgi:hypothetical protein
MAETHRCVALEPGTPVPPTTQSLLPVPAEPRRPGGRAHTTVTGWADADPMVVSCMPGSRATHRGGKR